MIVQNLGLVDYLPTCEKMTQFTVERTPDTKDELWLLEHYPVFSQGTNGQSSHILMQSDIPIVQADRGGQVTYHGPGQLVAYTLFDLKRLGIGVREMVTCIEESVISLLSSYSIKSYSDPDAPGVYVDGAKIASLGLRVKRGACYHGVSLNVAMDLSPFSLINPCGYQNMPMIDMKGLGCDVTMAEVKQQFADVFSAQLAKR